jgi:SHS2 domain-containing protein
MICVYEGANVVYFLGQEEDQYDVDIFWLSKDLFYKDTPLILYVKIENVMDGESVFIT